MRVPVPRPTLIQWLDLFSRDSYLFSLTATAVNFSAVISSVLKHRQEFLPLPSRPELLVQLPPVWAETCGVLNRL